MTSRKQLVCNGYVILLFIGIIVVKGQWVVDDDGCRTPYRGVGTCVLIRQCQPMLDFLAQSSGLSQRTVEVLRGYQCGYEGNSVKVCCPDGPIIVDRPKNPSTANIENHRNLNLLPSDCGILPGKNKIIGGNRTALFEYPWMALLSYETGKGPDFRCGGSIINNRYILTAAHCVTNLSTLKLIGVRCGEHNISSPIDCEEESPGVTVCAPPVQDVAIAEIIPHPSYNPTTYVNDIGLIRLATPLNISVESVKPICLPVFSSLRNINFTLTKLTVTGWGATESGRRSQDLLKVDIAVTSEEDCLKAYEKSPATITNKQFCAGGQDRRDSCGGDSGGPLQRVDAFDNDARFIQYGIVSFGPRFCGQVGFPGVYTRTDQYLDWVLDNIKP